MDGWYFRVTDYALFLPSSLTSFLKYHPHIPTSSTLSIVDFFLLFYNLTFQDSYLLQLLSVTANLENQSFFLQHLELLIFILQSPTQFLQLITIFSVRLHQITSKFQKPLSRFVPVAISGAPS